MATLYIRNLPEALVKAIRIKALQEGKRVDTLLTPFLELAANSQPLPTIEDCDPYFTAPASPAWSTRKAAK